MYAAVTVPTSARTFVREPVQFRQVLTKEEYPASTAAPAQVKDLLPNGVLDVTKVAALVGLGEPLRGCKEKQMVKKKFKRGFVRS